MHVEVEVIVEGVVAVDGVEVVVPVVGDIVMVGGGVELKKQKLFYLLRHVTNVT